MVGVMGQDNTEAITRDIRQLFTLTGLPETREGSNVGGYQLWVRSGRVEVHWFPENGLYDQAGQIGVDHPQHPMTRLERHVTAVMERALADVLYTAGFTVVLRPGVPNPVNLAKERDPEVIVVAGPEFKAWASG